MNVAEFIESVVRRPARRHVTLKLPDPQPAPADNLAPGYFQVRLSEMSLTDDRRWQQEIAPATFFLAEFNYADATVRQPFFVSNKLLSGLPDGIDKSKLRVRFRDTLVVGPTPYSGGDVALFVGLFKTAIEDKRQALFSVFETLFGSLDLGVLSQYVKIADKLSASIFSCLGGSDIECLLAERRVIGPQMLPPRGYLAYLRSRKGPVDTSGLVVHDDTLQRRDGAGLSPVDDLDYCLVRIEQLTKRNDYTKMDFHRTWTSARGKMIDGQQKEAQALMVECAHQLLASPDLSEDDKVSLIRLYQARLLAAQSLLAAQGGTTPATRAGTPSTVRQMQARAAQAGGVFESELLAKPWEEIAKLTTQLSLSPAGGNPLDEEQIAAHLNQASKEPRLRAAVLVQALAAGSIA
jgi:hypothetical protein